MQAEGGTISGSGAANTSGGGDAGSGGGASAQNGAGGGKLPDDAPGPQARAITAAAVKGQTAAQGAGLAQGATSSGAVATVQGADAAASMTASGQGGGGGTATGQSASAAGAELRPAITLPETISEEDRQNVSRVLRAAQTGLRQQGGSVTLRLMPPEMGVVRVHMQISDGIVRAQFATDTQQARQLLQQHMESLRQGLERQGLTVERLNVQTMPPSSGSASGGTHERDGTGQHDSDGRSRGQHGGPPQQGRDRQGSRQMPQRFNELLTDME